MMLSVMVMSTGATSFSDEDEFSPQYKEAAEVLTGMGVIQGYEDGSYFLPQRNITRAQVATMIYRAVTHDVNDTQTGIYKDYNKFKDVPSTDWSAGYVNYCANGEIIKGFTPDTFGPLKNVTGYQVLAMILRAVGYDANDEFTGDGWAIRVATTAQQLGILENVQEATLGEPATRELVAELIFQTMTKVDMVDYTPAFGYQPTWPRETLGEDEFDLKLTENTTDVWGRPSDTWTYKTGDKETVIEQDAVYTTNVKVDECDIAEAIGVTKSADIEAAYIDGVEYKSVKNQDITTDANGKIDATQTRSYVGAQGRQLEIFDMGDAGYRIVEINTYLAYVDKVTPSTTDKNGHTTDATVDLSVYLDDATPNSFDKVVATGFEKNDYVLVTITRDDDTVRSIELAPVVSGGVQTAYHAANGTTPAYITVGGDNYNNADKFILGLKTSNFDKFGWDVITDTYGNVIGLVKSAMSYLVIEAARFDATPGTVNEGQVLADLVLADGTRVDNAVIATVNGKDVSHDSTDVGDFNEATFADDTVNNAAYYNHLRSYSVNADGSYDIAGHGNTAIDTSNVTIVNKGTSFQAAGNTVYVNDNTTFLVKGDDTYTAYVGKNNVPDMEDATICYMVPDGETYASLVVVTSYKSADNTFDAYVYDKTSSTYEDGLYAFEVYKLGETAPTTVYYDQNTLPLKHNGTDTTTGIYTIIVDEDAVVQGDAKLLIQQGDTEDITSNIKGAGEQTWNRVIVGSNDGTTLLSNGATVESYNVTDADVYIVSYSKDRNLIDVTEGTVMDAVKGDQVWVGYTESGSTKMADYLYVVDISDKADVGEDEDAAGEITVNSITSNKSKFSISVTTDKALEVGLEYTIDIVKADDQTEVVSVTKTLASAKTAGQTFTIDAEYAAVSGAGNYTITVTFKDANDNVVASGSATKAVV